MPENSFDSPTLFNGRHFDSSIIILCVRWFITYKLSYRDLRDMMAERGINLAPTTILRLVHASFLSSRRSGTVMLVL
jgi:transposase-like protein